MDICADIFMGGPNVRWHVCRHVYRHVHRWADVEESTSGAGSERSHQRVCRHVYKHVHTHTYGHMVTCIGMHTGNHDMFHRHVLSTCSIDMSIDMSTRRSSYMSLHMSICMPLHMPTIHLHADDMYVHAPTPSYASTPSRLMFIDMCADLGMCMRIDLCACACTGVGTAIGLRLYLSTGRRYSLVRAHTRVHACVSAQ